MVERKESKEAYSISVSVSHMPCIQYNEAQDMHCHVGTVHQEVRQQHQFVDF
jgi:hypothetical protein